MKEVQESQIQITNHLSMKFWKKISRPPLIIEMFKVSQLKFENFWISKYNE